MNNDKLLWDKDDFEIKPLGPPSGIVHYIDVVYEYNDKLLWDKDDFEIKPLGPPSGIVHYIDVVYEYNNDIIRKQKNRKEKFKKLFDDIDEEKLR